jgi:tellurite methyltransferase
MDVREKWNRKYEKRLSGAGQIGPNERLFRLSDNLNGGAALDIACGLGGNSLFLAGIGYNVTAIDVSEVAIDFVSKQAAQQQMNVYAVAADLTDSSSFSFEDESYDLAVTTYYLERSLFSTIKNIVKKNGFFFMETFYKTAEGGKIDISNQYKLESNELLKEFKEWKILFYEENEKEGRQTIFCQKQGI